MPVPVSHAQRQQAEGAEAKTCGFGDPFADNWTAIHFEIVLPTYVTLPSNLDPSFFNNLQLSHVRRFRS